MRPVPLLLIVALLTGCAASSRPPGPPAASAPRAADDQVVRGVGNLRKLLVLPVVVQPAGCDWPDVARDLDEAAIRFLRDWKGYELVRPADPIAAAALAGQVAAWQEKSAASRTPPAELRGRLGAAAERAGTDGVLVVHAAPECPRGPEAGLLTLPARLAGSLDRTLSAGVYDAATGALVWQNQIRPAAWDPARYGAQPPPRFETRQAAETLFAPIENAIPAVLETSPRPRRPAPPAAVEVKPAREPTAMTPSPLPAPTEAGGAAPAPAAQPPAAAPAVPATPAPPTAEPSAPTEVAPPPAAPVEDGSPAQSAPAVPAGPESPATPPTAPEAPGVPPAAPMPLEPTAAPAPPPPAEGPPPTQTPVPALPAPEAPPSPSPADSGPPPTNPDPAPDAEPSPPKAPIRA